MVAIVPDFTWQVTASSRAIIAWKSVARRTHMLSVDSPHTSGWKGFELVSR
jgi:hypothetical protein